MPHDPVRPADEHGWLITPRALTSLATAVSLVYVLHQPVRFVMHVAATVDALTARVATLEGEVARERDRRAAVEAELAGAGLRPEGSAAPSTRAR